MNILNMTKWFNAIPPGAIKDNAAYVSRVLDRQIFLDQGAKGVFVLVQLGATDIAVAVLKLQQAAAASEANTLTDGEDLHDFTTKPGADDDGLFGVYVSMSVWTERYLQLQATAGNGTAGTYLSAIIVADMPGDGAGTAAALGLDVLEIATAA